MSKSMKKCVCEVKGDGVVGIKHSVNNPFPCQKLCYIIGMIRSQEMKE